MEMIRYFMLENPRTTIFLYPDLDIMMRRTVKMSPWLDTLILYITRNRQRPFITYLFIVIKLTSQ